MSATGTQVELGRQIIGRISQDRQGHISEQQLEVARAYLVGNYLPLGENDFLAVPTPTGKIISLVVNEKMELMICIETTPGNESTRQMWHGPLGNLKQLETTPTSATESDSDDPDNEQLPLPQMPQRFETGGEIFEVRWTDPQTPGLNTVYSHTRGDETLIDGMYVMITDLAVTDKHLIFTFHLDVLGTSTQWQVKKTQITVVNRGTGDHRIEEEGELIQARWALQPPFRELHSTGTRIVVVKRHPYGGKHATLGGVSIYTNRGHIFHRLRGDFSTLHYACGALWTWRPAPGGAVLTRYDLPNSD